MKKESDRSPDSDMRNEYDFSKGVRGKHAAHFPPGAKMVVLDPEVAAIFPDAQAVNRALRVLAEAARKSCREHSE